MLEVRVESFVGIKLRTVVRQIEHLHLRPMVLQPLLHGPAVMDLEVVHDAEHLARHVLDDALHELNEFGSVECPLALARLRIAKESIDPKAETLDVHYSGARAQKGEEGFWVLPDGQYGTFRCDEGATRTPRDWRLFGK